MGKGQYTDIEFAKSDENDGIRDELNKLYEEHGAAFLHDMLAKVDPEYAAEVHENNVKKVIRAIEFYRQTGHKLSEHNTEQRERTSPYNFEYFVLSDDRTVLYERIDKRIDKMVEAGLIAEVQALLDEGVDRESVAMQGLGYKEIASYLAGEISLDEAIYILKRDTRHFAKRQLTWFRREKDVDFVELDKSGSREAAFEYMLDVLKKKNII